MKSDWGRTDHGCRLLCLPAYTVASLIHSYPRTQISPENWRIDNGKDRIKPELPLPVHQHETLRMPCKVKDLEFLLPTCCNDLCYRENLLHHKLPYEHDHDECVTSYTLREEE